MKCGSRAIPALIAAALAAAVLAYGAGAMALSTGLKVPLYANALVSKILDTGSDQHGYLGGSTTITIGVSYDGASASVSITTKSSAYDAMAAMLMGIRNTELHRFISYGVGVNSQAKDGCGFANWECYSFTLLSRGHTAPPMPKDGYQYVSAHAYADYKVHHTWWWGLCHSDHVDHLTVYLSASVWNA